MKDNYIQSLKGALADKIEELDKCATALHEFKVSDRQKTNEINVLVKENNELAKENLVLKTALAGTCKVNKATEKEERDERHAVGVEMYWQNKQGGDDGTY